MTLDQIWARLCDIDIFKKDVGNRTKKVQSLEAIDITKGRDKDGKPIKGRIAGISKARQLMKQKEERLRKEKEEADKKKKGRKRR